MNTTCKTQLVVGTRLKVSFDDEGYEIIEKKMKNVLIRSKRKGEMFPLDLKSVIENLAIFLLAKASSDNSWLWQHRFSHLNFKDINKLVLSDHV